MQAHEPPNTESKQTTKTKHKQVVADQIRLDWPEAIIYMNEAPDIAMCNYRKDNTTVFAEDECLPQNIDWFGFDFYASDSASWAAVEETYASHIYPRLSRTDQRVVPVTTGYAEGNFTAAERADIDAFCTVSGSVTFMLFHRLPFEKCV